jgi:hypothetical protein
MASISVPNTDATAAIGEPDELARYFGLTSLVYAFQV